MIAPSKMERPLEEHSWVLCNLLGNTLKRQAITIVLTFIINRDKSNGVKLGGQRDCRNFGQMMDNAKAKGKRKKARGEHDIKVAKKWQTNQGESNATELTGKAIQTRGLVGGGLLKCGSKLRQWEGDFQGLCFLRRKTAEAGKEGGEMGGVRGKGNTRATGPAASAVVAVAVEDGGKK
jgi:hypothetical protein